MDRLNRKAVAALVAAVGLVGACDPSPETDRVGMTVTEDGRLVARFALCETETVEAIRLLRPEGEVVDDDDDDVLWTATASDGSAMTRAEIGSTPPGFRETKTLTEEPPADEEVVLAVETNRASAMVVGFEPRLLAEGRIYSQKRSVPDKTFAADGC